MELMKTVVANREHECEHRFDMVVAAKALPGGAATPATGESGHVGLPRGLSKPNFAPTI